MPLAPVFTVVNLMAEEDDLPPVPMVVPPVGLGCINCRSFTSTNFQRRCFSDTLVKCQGRSFYVHRLVLIYRSDYFELLFSRRAGDDFSTIHVDQCGDPLIFRALLIWLYEEEFDETKIYPDGLKVGPENDVEILPPGNDAERQLRGCFLMWAAAEMFGVEGLKEAIWRRIKDKGFFLDKPGPQGSISLDRAFDMLRDLFLFTGTGPCGIRSRYLAMRWASDHYVALWCTPFFDRALEIPGWFVEFRQFKTDAKLWTRKCPSCHDPWTTEMADDMVYACPTCRARHTVDEWAHGIGDSPHPVTMPAEMPR
ncbi:hypothetical protein IWX90DRAFT_495527 [Phyllosticta citrichinensis]|uniref:BTB domain-containing protein n=1 Tax=Phyllosticta citrichinensis TaxID=1130410 RepID=A0ABR1XFV6_9PEZI